MLNSESLPQSLGKGLHSRGCGGSGHANARARARARAGQAVGRHVLVVGLADDLEGAQVGVRDVGDGVAVQRWPVGDGAHLLHGDLRAGHSREAGLKGGVIAEGDVRTGALASRRVVLLLLGAPQGGGLGLGRDRSHTLGVLVQAVKMTTPQERYVITYLIRCIKADVFCNSIRIKMRLKKLYTKVLMKALTF